MLNLINTHIKSLPLHELHFKSWKIHLPWSTSDQFNWFFVRIKTSDPPSIVDKNFIFNSAMLAMKLGLFNGHQAFVVSSVLIRIHLISRLWCYLLAQIGSIFRPNQRWVVAGLSRLLTTWLTNRVMFKLKSWVFMRDSSFLWVSRSLIHLPHKLLSLLLILAGKSNRNQFPWSIPPFGNNFWSDSLILL